MSECSLCREPIQPEGGAILFTDIRGVPFEVCGKCEGAVVVLRTSDDKSDIKAARDYISECTDNLEYRDTYAALMDFIYSEEYDTEAQEISEDVPEHDDNAVELGAANELDAADNGKKSGKYMPMIVVIVLAGILILAYSLGGFRLG